MQLGSIGTESKIIAACPIICRGTGIGAVIIGSTEPLNSSEQDAIASLADALAGVLDDMSLSVSMTQLLAWRERDQSFCGIEMDLQDLPFVPDSLRLLPNIDSTSHGPLGSDDSKDGDDNVKMNNKCTNLEPMESQTHTPCAEHVNDNRASCGEKAAKFSKHVAMDLPNELNIRVFGLSWLYLSSVVIAKMFAPAASVSVSALLVAVLALVAGAGSMFVVFPGLLGSKLRSDVQDRLERIVHFNTLSLSAATVAAATNVALRKDC